MDLKGSLHDTNLRIYPSLKLINFLQTLSVDNIPNNILNFIDGKEFEPKSNVGVKSFNVELNNKDIENLKRINDVLKGKEITTEERDKSSEQFERIKVAENYVTAPSKTELKNMQVRTKDTDAYLRTLDIDWLYDYIHKRRSSGEKSIPYLHILLEGSRIEMPENRIIKRNPILEERCVKLRAQQEAKEYRKMTKSVDNVRLRFPEDSISYQLKSLNRQLIAIGQFIISIFAGFLFGFKGVEWMVGNLDFGFRLLLGVMCALVIALAEIYFLAKKLNEELNIPETVQLGGPPKFVDETHCGFKNPNNTINKEHQD